MGDVAQFHDPEGDRLIRLAESLGGAENLSEGERWRLAPPWTADGGRRPRARSRSRATDALGAQRLEDIESRLTWLKQFVDEVVLPVVGEVIGEAEQRSAAETKKLLDEHRGETDQKLNAQYDGFERAVTQLRDEDRAALLATVRETLSDAESRIDEHLEKALQTTWERCELEVALVRDEVLNILAEKKYGVFTDDDPAKLAERALAELRKRMTSVEEEGARQAARNDRLAGAADQLAALEEAHRRSTKNLLIRCAANVIAVKKERERADELGGKVERLEAELERLTAALLERGVIR